MEELFVKKGSESWKKTTGKTWRSRAGPCASSEATTMCMTMWGWVLGLLQSQATVL